MWQAVAFKMEHFIKASMRGKARLSMMQSPPRPRVICRSFLAQCNIG